MKNRNSNSSFSLNHSLNATDCFPKLIIGSSPKLINEFSVSDYLHILISKPDHCCIFIKDWPFFIFFGIFSLAVLLVMGHINDFIINWISAVSLLILASIQSFLFLLFTKNNFLGFFLPFSNYSWKLLSNFL